MRICSVAVTCHQRYLYNAIMHNYTGAGSLCFDRWHWLAGETFCTIICERDVIFYPLFAAWLAKWTHATHLSRRTMSNVSPHTQTHLCTQSWPNKLKYDLITRRISRFSYTSKKKKEEEISRTQKSNDRKTNIYVYSVEQTGRESRRCTTDGAINLHIPQHLLPHTNKHIHTNSHAILLCNRHHQWHDSLTIIQLNLFAFAIGQIKKKTFAMYQNKNMK